MTSNFVLPNQAIFNYLIIVHDSLNDLFDDAIVHIMQFLDVREIITASMISKRFALLATSNLLKMVTIISSIININN